MSNILPTVRRIEASEWRDYKEIRLRALQDSPDAFGGTYEVSRTYSDEAWQGRLSGAAELTDFPMFAVVEGKIVGLAWVKIESPETAEAHLYQMWVDPDARGLGVGQALMMAGISWATQQGIEQLVLDVTIGNEPARRLYERLGFQPVGDLVPLREGSDLMEQTMVLALRVAGIST